VTLVILKPGPGADSPLHPAVRVIHLAAEKSWRRRCVGYRDLLAKAGGRAKVASISFCFSADLMNLACRHQAIICASVRGNLVQNYRMDYSVPGVPLAMIHLVMLRGFDHVVAMTGAMAKQVRFYAGRNPKVIGNFVDEAPLAHFSHSAKPEGAFRFVFLGSLTPRKQPLLLVKAIDILRRYGKDVRLDLVGEGPLRVRLEAEVLRRGLTGIVTLHGHLAAPHGLVAHSDVLVLPSLSEGLSRAALEALHLGIPCVMRATDGNAELIMSGKNGALFCRDEDLPKVMFETAEWSRNRSVAVPRASLLPLGYRQNCAAMRYLSLLEER
jgi:glycosyltransferase involved in cell wall biosynthesis